MKVYTHVQFGRFYNIDIKEEQVKKERKFKRNILGEKNVSYSHCKLLHACSPP
jgi:hypothetical protein